MMVLAKGYLHIKYIPQDSIAKVHKDKLEM